MAATDLHAQGVKVISPNGGEVWGSGSSQDITWEAPASAINFKLQYSVDSGVTWRSVVSGTVTGSSYSWEVPVQTANRMKCLIKVIGLDSNNQKIGADKSDAPFQIEVIRLTSPKGGETFAPGTAHHVTWTTNKTARDVLSVSIQYTTDGGVTWKKAGAVSGNPGTYDWTPRGAKLKKKCKVKVVLKDRKGLSLGSDTSDAFFKIDTVSPTIASFSANPGAIAAGQNLTLSWNISNAASASIDQGVGSVDPISGLVEVNLVSTTTYTLTAINAFGEVTAQAKVIPVGPDGGTVTSDDQKVQIVIPAGALTQETLITIQGALNPPSGHIGMAYEFGPSGLTFQLPATVSITYDEASLPAGLSETSLRLGTVLSSLHWCEILGSSINTTANTVTGQTYSFSTYGLVIGSFSSTFEGAQEVPATASVATGTGVFSIDTSKNILSYQISYQNLEGEEQSAEICGPASRGQTGSTLDTLPLGPYKTGIWIYDESLEQDILEGRVYVNIRSTTYADGEIRGQIEPLGPEGMTATVTLRVTLWNDLSGSAPTAGVPAAVNTMKLRVSGPGMAPMEQWMTVPTGLVEEDITVAKGAIRRIDVMAYDSTDQIIYKASAFMDISKDTETLDMVMMGASDVTPPVFAGVTGVTQIDSGSVVLSWPAATDDKADIGEITYLVYVATSPGGENLTMPSYATRPGTTDYTVSGLAPGKTYYFVVRAMDSSGNVDTNTVEMSESTYSSGTGIYVDVNTGADTPSCGRQASPCKTISRALAMTAGNEAIYVAEGLYDVSSGETFPLQLKAGTALIGQTWLKAVGPFYPLQPSVIAPLTLIRYSNLSSVILGAANAFIAGFIIEFGLTNHLYPIIDSAGHPITIMHCALYGAGNKNDFTEGVHIAGGSRIESSLISGFRGISGNGILAHSGSSVISANTITNNEMGICGAAIIHVIGNIIKDNTWGIYMVGSGWIYNNSVSNNYYGIQISCPVLGVPLKVLNNSIIMNWEGLNIEAMWDCNPETVLVSGNFIFGNNFGVEVIWWAKAIIQSNDLSCNNTWNLYVAGTNADTRVDARYNYWRYHPPLLNPGRTDDPGCYPAEDVDICYEAVYGATLPPPYEPSFQGGCEKYWGF
jgi:parallel beta-helix repeat protein